MTREQMIALRVDAGEIPLGMWTERVRPDLGRLAGTCSCGRQALVVRGHTLRAIAAFCPRCDVPDNRRPRV